MWKRPTYIQYDTTPIICISDGLQVSALLLSSSHHQLFCCFSTFSLSSVECHHIFTSHIPLSLLILPPPLPPPAFSFWRRSWRGGAASAVFFLRTVLLMQNTDGYYGAAHKLIMLEINCCCQRQPPTCPSVSLCPLMHRIQLMDQMFAQCAALFKVSTKVVKGLSDFCVFVLLVGVLLPFEVCTMKYMILNVTQTTRVLFWPLSLI